MTRRVASVVKEVLQHQLAMKYMDTHSWTTLIRELLFVYGLPNAYNILSSPPSRPTWKNHLKRCVHELWLENLKAEAFLKSTIKFLNCDSCTFGKVHPM